MIGNFSTAAVTLPQPPELGCQWRVSFVPCTYLTALNGWFRIWRSLLLWESSLISRPLTLSSSPEASMQSLQFRYSVILWWPYWKTLPLTRWHTCDHRWHKATCARQPKSWMASEKSLCTSLPRPDSCFLLPPNPVGELQNSHPSVSVRDGL